MIRTTFKTRKSKEVREDEDEDKKRTEEDEEGIRLKMLKGKFLILKKENDKIAYFF